MRIGGHNLLAILIAAIAVFAIGFLFYAVLFAQAWQSWTGITEAAVAEANAGWRMALMPVMPIMTAIGMSFVVNWRNARSLASGALTGLIVGLFVAVGTRLYGFAYGLEVPEILYLDSAHLLLNHIVAGAILGAMR